MIEDEPLPAMAEDVKERLKRFHQEFDSVTTDMKERIRHFCDDEIGGLPICCCADYPINDDNENAIIDDNIRIAKRIVDIFCRRVDVSEEEYEEATAISISCLLSSLHAVLGEHWREVVLIPVPQLSPLRNALLWNEPVKTIKELGFGLRVKDDMAYEIGAVEKDGLYDDEIVTFPKVIFNPYTIDALTPVVLLDGLVERDGQRQQWAKDEVQFQLGCEVIGLFALARETYPFVIDSPKKSKE